jgi:NAD(P)-dependent dehydrogenase (short-subunit alcohol dehydrogenase family)
MGSLCKGRVVIVTGAGRGLGREHALEFARQGAKVVVNDLGVGVDGTAPSAAPANEVVAAIQALGGEAITDGADVADWKQAEALVRRAVERFGRLDVLVCNAGILRDRMFCNATEEEFDAVVRVHLKGHFAVARHAAAYWRDESKAGRQPSGRIINTSSGAGLAGSIGQAVYSAAKGAIASLTLVQAAELGRYGVTANAIGPSARTRMTESLFSRMQKPEQGFDAGDPSNISPLVVWLGSEESGDVSGRVFELEGGMISVADGWQPGPRVEQAHRWDPELVGPAVRALIAKAPRPQRVHGSGS